MTTETKTKTKTKTKTSQRTGTTAKKAVSKKTAPKKSTPKKRASRTGTGKDTGNGSTKKLVIVESPTKARTITRYLDKSVIVESSMGHVRDLPGKADQIPAKYRDQSWARLGVDVENDFTPIYINTKPEQIKRLKKLLPQVGEVLLATDEDREGEAIAWHLQEVLNPKVPVKRMVFHEITKVAIEEAFQNPRELNEQLFMAQESRRILDRLYGFEVSPVLWRKVKPKLSAGRVQSVAVRMIVDRERDRMEFRSASYWQITGTFVDPDQPELSFPAVLAEMGGKPVATGSSFNSKAEPKKGTTVLTESAAEKLVENLDKASYEVDSVVKKPYQRKPPPPFRTSTLQIEASRRLRISAQQTMQLAQQLYEKGYITYMRTDSTTLSAEALRMARREVEKHFGSEYLPSAPRKYDRKVAGAQEAHEAIRPAGAPWKTPQVVASEVSKAEARLYDLIWRRTLASQMKNLVGEQMTVRIHTKLDKEGLLVFRAGGRTITFLGFMRAYTGFGEEEETEEDSPGDDGANEEKRLPELTEESTVNCLELTAFERSTKPPGRYTEATLVERLEQEGIGRPSTYAQIISTIINRGYIWKRGMALVPTFIAFVVVRLLEKHFPTLVDYKFTAAMESDLDQIAVGEKESRPYLSDFYFGLQPLTTEAEKNTTSEEVPGEGPSDDHREEPGEEKFRQNGLHKTVEEEMEKIDAREINTLPLGVDEKGTPIEIRVGRYGPFLQRGPDTANIPDSLLPDEITLELAEQILDDAQDGPKILGRDPETKKMVSLRTGRFGPYVQLDEIEEKTKPKRASLLKSMVAEEVSLEVALQLLSLPRSLGQDPETEDEVLVFNGRYGPYIQRAKDRRSLQSEDQIFSVTMEEAQQLLSEPPKRRGQRTQAPLRELGETDEGKKVVMKSGRYGVYVTDGKINASLLKDDDPETITLGRAKELLEARRERIKQG